MSFTSGEEQWNHVLAPAVLVITFDEWGGFYDHVPPPTVTDDTNPAGVNHSGDSSTPTDGQLYPNCAQLGFRVPAIVVSDLVTPGQVIHSGPFEHTSTLALIESTFGLNSLTARDANTKNLAQLLLGAPAASPVDPASSADSGPPISAPSETLTTILEGTANFDPAAQCRESSVQSVSPAAVSGPGQTVPEFPWSPALSLAVAGTAGMVALNHHYRKIRRSLVAASELAGVPAAGLASAEGAPDPDPVSTDEQI
ncbi:MAG TPA: alkaline phosphatase family protein [Acidimicrobiales bacterium]|nr:alkaline phosphatase family protein [Acidimicrobiales bacterium]